MECERWPQVEYIYAYADEDPVSNIDPLGLFDWPSIPDPVANSLVGLGDGAYHAITLGFGNLQDVRNVAGIDGGVDLCSTAYKAGRIAGEIDGAGALGGAVFTRVAGPFRNWLRLGPSYSKSLQTSVDLSLRWGASPARNGKYIQEIPTQFMRDLN